MTAARIAEARSIENHPTSIVARRIRGDAILTRVGRYDNLNSRTIGSDSRIGESGSQRRNRLFHPGERIEQPRGLSGPRLRWQVNLTASESDLGTGFQPAFRQTRNDANSPLATAIGAKRVDARIGIECE